MNQYEINIKTIIDAMNNNFAQFDKEYLHNEFYYDVKFHLEENNVLASVPFRKEDKEYFYDYINRHRQDCINSINYANFPFPDYYLRIYKIENEKIVDIVELNAYCIVKKANEKFDLFFAYQLNLTDIMELDKFLEFHLRETFENNFNQFESFLLKVMLKYNSFLVEKHNPLVEHFLKNSKTNNSKELPNTTNKQFTTARQVLAIHYLLNEINDNIYNTTSKTEIARFIQFLTGKEPSTELINNTTIYKKVKQVFSQNEITLENDLKFIRNYFEKLNLQNIVNQINKEISNKQ
ncbi:MAG: hypothetical protein U0U67_15100 [Chitinophagales bacterium]